MVRCVNSERSVVMEQMLVLRMTGIVSLTMAAALLPSLVYALAGEPEMILLNIFPFDGNRMVVSLMILFIYMY